MNTTFGEKEIKALFKNEIINNKDIDIILKYLTVLSRAKDPKIIEEVINYLEQAKDNRLKASVVKFLPVASNHDYIPLLAKLLRDENNRVRANTVEALSLCGSSRLKKLLLPMVDDPDNRTKSNTLIALWQCDELRDKIIECFEKMVKDPSRWMRASAFYAFGEIGVLEFTDECISALAEKDELVAKNAVLALIGYAEKYIDDSVTDQPEL